MTPAPLYRLSNLTFRYGTDGFALSIPEMDIEAGASIGLVGPNGGGKSTLLKLLAFLETPQKGTIFFQGKKVSGAGDPSVMRSVTILLQEPYLLQATVFENVAYGLRIRGEKEGVREKVADVLERVGLPYGEFGHRKWHQLSGGEAQRVALASRLILKPLALLLDEPTASVDPYSAYRIREAIVDVWKTFKTTLLVASHDEEWLNGSVDRIYKVHDGKIIGSGDENLLPGPWEPAPDSLWKKGLEGGRTIVAPPPPHRESTALLRGTDVDLYVSEWQEKKIENIIPGVITGMYMESFKGHLNIYVDIGGITILSVMAPERADHLRVLPGKKIWVAFPASALRWL